MTTLTASSSQPVEPGLAVAATLVAVTLFLVGWGALHRGFFANEPIVDTPTYERYGSAMNDGQVPYRDFAVEYPPGALPMFAIPALGNPSSETFRVRFEALMAFFGQAMIVSLAVAHVALGVAVAAKLYPAVLAPLSVVYVWKREGRREALLCAGLMLAVVAVVFAPFVVVAPGGVWDSLWNQASRPLQIESLGAGVLLVAHHVSGTGVTMETSHGSQNLAGTAPEVLAVLQTALQAGALLATWILFARGPATRERLLYASAAALVAFIALGKVLSPQFLIWLIPVIPLVAGRRGLIASALLAAALVATQLWFPYRYWDLALQFGALESWLVLVRDLLLVGLMAVLVWWLLDREPERLATRRPA
jgi:hypothetical protein